MNLVGIIDIKEDLSVSLKLEMKLAYQTGNETIIKYLDLVYKNNKICTWIEGKDEFGGYGYFLSLNLNRDNFMRFYNRIDSNPYITYGDKILDIDSSFIKVLSIKQIRSQLDKIEPIFKCLAEIKNMIEKDYEPKMWFDRDKSIIKDIMKIIRRYNIVLEKRHYVYIKKLVSRIKHVSENSFNQIDINTLVEISCNELDKLIEEY